MAQPAPTTGAPAEETAAWVANLPVAEKDVALLTLLRGDDPHLRAGLLRRFGGSTQTQPGIAQRGSCGPPPRPDGKDPVRAGEEGKRRVAEEQEREHAAKRAHRLATLAADGDWARARVDAMIETKKPAEYDRAVELLDNFQGVVEPAEFERRVAELRVRHARMSSSMDRLDRAGL